MHKKTNCFCCENANSFEIVTDLKNRRVIILFEMQSLMHSFRGSLMQHTFLEANLLGAFACLKSSIAQHNFFAVSSSFYQSCRYYLLAVKISFHRFREIIPTDLDSFILYFWWGTSVKLLARFVFICEIIPKTAWQGEQLQN